MPELTATRPAPPFADAKARLAAAVEAARPEIIDLSHRIHANPEPAFEEHQAAGWIAEVLARHGYAVEAPAARSRRRSVPSAGVAAGRRPADRDPGRIRRPARSRTRLRPQHDGRLGGRCRHRAGGARRRAARRDRVPRDAGRGTWQRQADHDGRRPVRRHRCRAALPPVRPVARGELSARLGGRRRRLHRPPVACVVRSVAWQERAGRDSLLFTSVGLWRQQLRPRPASTGSPRGRHGGQHHPRPDSRLVHDPERRRGRLRTDARPLPRAVRGGRPGLGHHR